MNPTDYKPKDKVSIYLNDNDNHVHGTRIIILGDYYLFHYTVEIDKIRVFPLNEITHFKYRKDDIEIRFWATNYRKISNTRIGNGNRIEFLKINFPELFI